MRIKWKEMIICIAIPLLVGGLAAFLTKDSMAIFATVNKPPLSPPGWLFPVVWTILYILMGIASYLVLRQGPNKDVTRALIVYGIQLLFNFCWSIIFFNMEAYLLAFIWLVALWLLILLAIKLFDQVSSAAGWLLIPYFAWVSFAGYLNLGISLLN